MQFGEDVTGRKCPRCSGELKGELVFRFGSFYHKLCWEEGENQLSMAQARADEVIQRFGFKPTSQSA